MASRVQTFNVQGGRGPLIDPLSLLLNPANRVILLRKTQRSPTLRTVRLNSSSEHPPQLLDVLCEAALYHTDNGNYGG